MRSDSVGIAKQTAKGTKNTTMQYFMPVESSDPTYNRETMSIEETIGNRFPTGMDYGTGYWEAGLQGAIRPTAFPRLGSAFWGLPTTTTPTGGTLSRLHTFDPAAAGKIPEVHSMLFTRADPSPSIRDLLFDCYGNSLTLSVEPNGYGMFEANMVAKSNDDTLAAPTVTSDASPRFKFHEATAQISVDGAALTTIPLGSFSLSYNNNFDTDQVVLGSQSLYDLFEENADAEVRFTVRETLSTHYRRALQANPASVKIVLTATSASMIEGALPYKLIVTVFSCEYLEAPAPISASDRLLSIDVTARARYDTAASKFIQVEIQNGIASYAT